MRKTAFAATIVLLAGCGRRTGPVPIPSRPGDPPIPSPALDPSVETDPEVRAALIELKQDWQGFEQASLSGLPTRAEVQEQVDHLNKTADEIEALSRSGDSEALQNYFDRANANRPPNRSKLASTEADGYRRALLNIHYPVRLVALQGAIAKIVDTFVRVPSVTDVDRGDAQAFWKPLTQNANRFLRTALLEARLPNWEIPSEGILVRGDQMSWTEYREVIEVAQRDFERKLQPPSSDFDAPKAGLYLEENTNG